MKSKLLKYVLIMLFASSGLCRGTDLLIYGYFSTRYEKVFNEPYVDGSGKTDYETAAGEWSYPYFSLMAQQQLNEEAKVYINLNGGDAEGVNVRNMWGEYVLNDLLTVRVGKTYRRFGLYNEILDAVPTYIGIEPPELFDNDHLLVSRTTTFMLHGALALDNGAELQYSASTDNGEGGGAEKGTFPLGLDLRYATEGNGFVIGSSAYLSNGELSPDKAVGDGSPAGGVLPWMESDNFYVIGGYAEYNKDQWLFQAACWYSKHEGTRDPGSVVSVVNNAGINSNQRSRFLIDPTLSGPATEANVDVNGDYDVLTSYARIGYSTSTDVGEFVPYVQWDWYKNEETIQSKTYGGDNEAGAADNGEFTKLTAGVVYRPMPDLAIKLDGSAHIYEFNGDTELYPEIRLDISYIFGL